MEIPVDTKIEGYRGLKEQLEQMWKVKYDVIPVVVEALEAVGPNLREKLQQIRYNIWSICPEELRTRY